MTNSLIITNYNFVTLNKIPYLSFRNDKPINAKLEEPVESRLQVEYIKYFDGNFFYEKKLLSIIQNTSARVSPKGYSFGCLLIQRVFMLSLHANKLSTKQESVTNKLFNRFNSLFRVIESFLRQEYIQKTEQSIRFIHYDIYFVLCIIV
ncbi:hypothetical protein PUN28_015910 [Cardiocondyla obscurior]|uniref:Uncharacterized protein n=1 Tax=Cardiocondyla obscurior TaxID=286306 RepID=A0AAW2ER81_9HYME